MASRCSRLDPVCELKLVTKTCLSKDKPVVQVLLNQNFVWDDAIDAAAEVYHGVSYVECCMKLLLIFYSSSFGLC